MKLFTFIFKTKVYSEETLVETYFIKIKNIIAVPERSLLLRKYYEAKITSRGMAVTCIMKVIRSANLATA